MGCLIMTFDCRGSLSLSFSVYLQLRCLFTHGE